MLLERFRALSNSASDTSRMAEVELRKKFEWSLKPLEIITRFFVGVTLNFSNTTSVSVRLILLVFGCFIIISNFLVNGPRSLKINSFEWMEEIQNFESPYLFFPEFPDALLQFVVDVTFTMLWATISLIHIIFLLMVTMSEKWTFLIQSLKEIENSDMQFGKVFYRKCRKHYFIAIVVFILVSSILKENFKTLLI